jgi:hypothetical protein
VSGLRFARQLADMTTRHTSHQLALRTSAFSVACALALGVAFASPASADVLPPEEEACEALGVGASCMTPGQGPGTCMMATCARLDYAHWDRDASMTPPSMEYDCTRCVVEGDGGATADSGHVAMDTPPRGGACSVGFGSGAASSSWTAGLIGLGLTVLARRSRR